MLDDLTLRPVPLPFGRPAPLRLPPRVGLGLVGDSEFTAEGVLFDFSGWRYFNRPFISVEVTSEQEQSFFAEHCVSDWHFHHGFELFALCGEACVGHEQQLPPVLIVGNIYFQMI